MAVSEYFACFSLAQAFTPGYLEPRRLVPNFFILSLNGQNEKIRNIISWGLDPQA